jgi:hypothetical protein
LLARQITNSRRRLQNAQYTLEQYSMKIISLHQRKQQLQAMKDALKKLADLKGMVERMESCAQQGAFSEAATCAMQVRDVVQTPAFNQFHVAQHLYRRVQQILPQLHERVDKSLYRVCSRRFTPAEYAEVVRSYLVLENLRQDFEPRQETTEDDSFAQTDCRCVSFCGGHVCIENQLIWFCCAAETRMRCTNGSTSTSPPTLTTAAARPSSSS